MSAASVRHLRAGICFMRPGFFTFFRMMRNFWAAIYFVRLCYCLKTCFICDSFLQNFIVALSQLMKPHILCRYQFVGIGTFCSHINQLSIYLDRLFYIVPTFFNISINFWATTLTLYVFLNYLVAFIKFVFESATFLKQLLNFLLKLNFHA